MARKNPDKSGAALEIGIKASAGAVAGGPGGAAVAGSAEALKQVIEWVRQNSFGGTALARLQEDRLLDAIKQASETIDAMRASGYSARRDWFGVHNTRVIASASGVELLEGMLIAAANEFERRKVKLTGNLWAQCTFNPSIRFEACVFLLKSAEELSYQQLAILATLAELAGPPPSAEDAELDHEVAKGPTVSPFAGPESNHPFRGSSTTAAQVYDLIRRDIIRQDGGNEVPSNTRQVRPWDCSPTLTGKRLYVLTGMRTLVPLDEKRGLAAELTKHR